MANQLEDTTSSETLKALERFVVDNDELQQLEEAIGRFNIFDALGIARVEIRHSNFLAWLLDPSESHGLGALFLKAVLMDLLRKAPLDKRPFSPIDLDGGELRGVEIRREWQNIDLLILCQEPRFVIAVENKVDSGEHSNQLQRYEEKVAAEYSGFLAQKNAKAMYVYLTREGDEPSDADWVVYSYAEICEVLERTRKSYAKSIGADVQTFLDHYLSLIRSRFMENQQIIQLCRQIYRNHRHALDLIWDQVGGGLVVDAEEMLRNQHDRWNIFNSTSKHVFFVPAVWMSWLPTWCALPKADAQSWLIWSVDLLNTKCRIRILIRPCSNASGRQQVISRLTQDPQEFGFKTPSQGGERWATVFSKTIHQWDEDSEPDREELLAKIGKEVDLLEPKLGGIAAALKPIIEKAK